MTRKAPSNSKKRGGSQYDKFPLPFFDKSKRLTWNANPTGDIEADAERGREYARQFLVSCDGTIGWNTLLGQIVSDIVRMGPARTWPDGGVSCGSVVTAFFGEISRALTLGEFLKGELIVPSAEERRKGFYVIDGGAA